jgi:hypothetical protein
MGGREDETAPESIEPEQADAERPSTPRRSEASPAFPIHEPIGRQLRAIFDEVTSQPVPDKFLKLLEELERKSTKD